MSLAKQTHHPPIKTKLKFIVNSLNSRSSLIFIITTHPSPLTHDPNTATSLSWQPSPLNSQTCNTITIHTLYEAYPICPSQAQSGIHPSLNPFVLRWKRVYASANRHMRFGVWSHHFEKAHVWKRMQCFLHVLRVVNCRLIVTAIWYLVHQFGGR